jgi:hypothetical protein
VLSLPKWPTATPITWLWPAAIGVAIGPLVLTVAGLLAVALRPGPQMVTETAHLPPAPPVLPLAGLTAFAEVPVEPGEARPFPKGFVPPVLDEPSVPADPVEAAKCDRFGTQIDFVRSPAIAFDRAGREGKLAMVLHLAGHFEDPGFT